MIDIPMIRLLIIGFGNPLRSDDALGWHIAQELLRGPIPDDVLVVAEHQLTPEMSEIASRAERILFVDAARHGDPGCLKCDQLEPATSSVCHTHDLSPAMVLRLAKDLYGRSPAAHLFTIAGESFETGEAMSPAVLAAIPTLMQQVRKFVDGDRDKEEK
jgi:hydrogenase maturation protease